MLALALALHLAALYLAAQGGSPPATVAEGRRLLVSGALEPSIGVLRRVIEREPKSFDAYVLLGTALSLVPKRSEAIEAFERAIAIRPRSAQAHYTLGLAWGRFAEPENARRAFEKAVAIEPTFADAHTALAQVAAATKDYAVALRHLEESIRLQPTPQLFYLKGAVYLEQQEPESAATAFEHAVKMRPAYPEALLALGLSRRQAGRNADALASLQRAASAAPKDARIQAELGRQYLVAGDSSRAAAHLEAAIQLKPDDPGILYSLSRALRSSGQPEKADAISSELKTVLLAANRSTQFEANARNNEGVELDKLGKHPAALERYRAALEMDPLNTGYRRNFALCLCRLGRWNEGIAELREILRQDPNDAEAAKALYIALDESRRQ